MSAGQYGVRELSHAELDSLLEHALADPGVKKRLARGFRLDVEHDVALLGSSAIGGWTVFLDRHMKFRNWPYGIIPVQSRRLDSRPGLIRHERLEQACEDCLGWPYLLAHQVAEHFENRYYASKGFDPAAVERAYRPFIKSDALEKIVKTPTDLDKRPLLAPPQDTKILERIKAAEQKEKRTHESVKYEEKSMHTSKNCGKCAMFIQPMYGGPACVGVQDSIASGGYCRRFRAGKLGEQSEG